MLRMFEGCQSLACELGEWDTGCLKDVRMMFYGAKCFD
ncbi:MAG: BspA family leucine-rich repeat surface protein, partial [Clostridia bacterium]|nr:BspA family leucine-rich repeat surface protein [Clostridia bacterium]